MNHAAIEKNNWLEKYLLHELTAKEETLLEEHLLYCDECIKELEIIKKSLAYTKKALKEELFNTYNGTNEHKTKLLTPIFYKIAAISLLVLAIGTAIIYIRWKPSAVQMPVVGQTLGHQKQITVGDSATKSQVPLEKPLVAEAFELNSMYENEIKNTYRSSDLSDICPIQNAPVKQGTILRFSWNYNGNDSLHFVILNNKGKELIDKKVKTYYVLKKSLRPGLYYWQIQSETDLLHTSKFIVE